jgi:MBG domain (YGX type)/MBG domain
MNKFSVRWVCLGVSLGLSVIPAFGQSSVTGLLASYYDTWVRMTTNGVSSGQNCFYEVTPFDVTSGSGTNTFTLRTTNFPGAINIYVTKFYPLTPVENFWDNGVVTNAAGTLVYKTFLNPGSYECVVSTMNAGQTGTYGLTISGPAATTIKPRPTTPNILQSPANQTILTNTAAVLQFSSEGAYPRHYQWHQGASGFPTNAIAGATNFTLITPRLTNSGDYFYWARVTNAFGTADTATARVRVTTNGGPTLVSGKLRVGNRRWNRPNGSGGAVTNLSYYKMFTYQAFSNGTYVFSINTTNFNGTLDLYDPFFSPTSPNLGHDKFATNGNPVRMTNVVVNPTTYVLVISSTQEGQTGSYSGTISGPALLNELPNPYFTQQPAPSNQVIWPGEDPVPISVGTITPDVTYEWYPGVSPGVPADGLSPISGATSNVYDPPPTTTSQWFWARIYNTYGYEDSDLAQVFVRPMPAFTLYPANQTVPYGTTNTLTAVATNIPFVLNWFAGTSPLMTNLLTSVVVQGVSTNYTNSAQISYTLPVLPPGAYNFWLQSTNLAGTTNGNTFTITVIKRPLTVALTIPAGTSYDGTAKVATASASDPNPGGPPLPNPLEIDITYQLGALPPTNTPPVDAGNYTVVAAVNDPNFSGSATGTLAVAKTPLTVVPDDKSRLYGDINPPLTLTFLGFTNSDTTAVIDTLPIASTTAVTNSPIGHYPITAASGVDNDYSFSYRTGTLNITRSPLTLNGPNVIRPYGQTNPPFIGSIVGLKNNDPIIVTWLTSATNDSPPGVYPLTPSISDPNSRLGNYTVTTNDGSLTIILFVTVVTNNNDSGAGSLRQAVQDVVAENFITFASNVTGVITLTNGQISITKGMNILGPGANVLTVSGVTNNRMLSVTNSTVHLSGLTFANGNISANGGAIFQSSGTLWINQCVFSNNLCTGTSAGGAIFVNAGTLSISNSTFVANRTLDGNGGAIYNPGSGAITIVNSTFCRNVATNSFFLPGGGAIAYATAAGSSLTLLSCTIVSNSAAQGGGIFKTTTATGSIKNSIIANNAAPTGPDLSGSNYTSGGFNLIGKSNGSTGFTNTLAND